MSNENKKMLAWKLKSETPVYRCGDTNGKSCNLGNQFVTGKNCNICIYKKDAFTAGTLNTKTVINSFATS